MNPGNPLPSPPTSPAQPTTALPNPAPSKPTTRHRTPAETAQTIIDHYNAGSDLFHANLPNYIQGRNELSHLWPDLKTQLDNHEQPDLNPLLDAISWSFFAGKVHNTTIVVWNDLPGDHVFVSSWPLNGHFAISLNHAAIRELSTTLGYENLADAVLSFLTQACFKIAFETSRCCHSNVCEFKWEHDLESEGPQDVLFSFAASIERVANEVGEVVGFHLIFMMPDKYRITPSRPQTIDPALLVKNN